MKAGKETLKSEKRIISGVQKLDIMRFIMGRFTFSSPKIVFLPHLSAMLQIYKSSKLTISKPCSVKR